MNVRWSWVVSVLPCLLAAMPAGAQDVFTGSWNVVDAQVAPWIDPAQSPQPEADAAMRQGTIVISPEGIEGPPPLDCTPATYEVKKVGPEFLFQGGLPDPGPQATALGFSGAEIMALSMGCVRDDADIGMDFALVDADTAVFALDNIVYRMKRAANRSAEATSSFAMHAEGGQSVVEISNVTFETTGSFIPGRPQDERLLLRISTRTREVIGDKGADASVTVEAWPLGSDMAAAPLYAATRDGVGAEIVDNALLVFDRSNEDLAWWSVHALGTGEPMFDTHVPLRSFSLSREVQELRYAGLEVPPDDAADPRLRAPDVVGVLAYASPERVLTRLLITCGDAERAAMLRSYWDTTRELSVIFDGNLSGRPARKLLITWQATGLDQTDMTVPVVDIAAIPLSADDLDLANAQLPPCIALAPWTP